MRNFNAESIQLGACNPSGIALSIVQACREMRAEPDHQGTDAITSDPAVRAMVHQLAFICNVSAFDADYTAQMKIVEERAKAEREAAQG
jgi:hypothetical protein